jgi:hypothetical protein
MTMIRLHLPDWGNPHDEEPWAEQVLSDSFAPIPGLRWEGKIVAHGVLRVSGHLGFQIEGDGQNDKFLLAVVVKVNAQETYRASTNVRRDQHYIHWPISALAEVAMGQTCVVEVFARAHLKEGSKETKVCFKEPHYTSVWVEVPNG